MHFLVHYPEQIMNVGPMVRSWTIRYEAKLNFFKRASHIGNNFKNISYSLASRHQRWMCYELASKKLLVRPLECGPAKCNTGLSFLNDETSEVKEGLVKVVPELNSEATIFRPKWINCQRRLCMRH